MKNTKFDWKVIAYIVIALLVIALLIATFFPGMIYAVRDSGVFGSGAGSSNSAGGGASDTSDICKPQSGYTEAEWREHMGHHPSIYKDCL